MGDRGNIVVLDGKQGVWLYSHWGGSRLEETARKAVESSGRVGDPSYLTRIIFCNMIADGFRDYDTKEMGRELVNRELKRDNIDVGFFVAMIEEFLSETGAGIATWGAGDQEHPTVCVDGRTGEIWLDHNRPTTTEQVLLARPVQV